MSRLDQQIPAHLQERIRAWNSAPVLDPKLVHPRPGTSTGLRNRPYSPPVSFNTRRSFTAEPKKFRPLSYGSLLRIGADGQRLPDPSLHQLPKDVCRAIVNQLRQSHPGPESTGCTTCCQRDLSSLSLVNRHWASMVKPILYEKIWIVGPESPHNIKKKFKMNYGCRLKLLRRTLRSRPALANHVLELKAPSFAADYQDAKSYDEAINIVASVIMACPNLERLVGLYPTYNHTYDRVAQALSTRPHLREQVWVISGEQRVTKKSRRPSALVQPEEAANFLHFHTGWKSLDTLVLHSVKGGTLDHEMFVSVMSHLPALAHLYVSGFDADDFNDLTLLALPTLDSLRLENLHGITDSGVARFASKSSSATLKSLSLIDLEIMEMSIIARLLSNLRLLRKLTLVQHSSPELPLGGLVFQPFIASTSLQFIHWDILVPGSGNATLAASIRAHGFPGLRVLRAPSDHDGSLQNVCRPRVRISPTAYGMPLTAGAAGAPSSSFASLAIATRRPTGGPAPPTPNPSAAKKPPPLPTAPLTPEDPDRYTRSLAAARQDAQTRIEDARRRPWFMVVVEQDGIVAAIERFAGFAGAIGSRVRYELGPDLSGRDVAVAGVGDLLEGEDSGGTAGGAGGEGRGRVCEGKGNAGAGAGGLVKGRKEWGGHAPRGRWEKLDLKMLF